MIIRETPLPLKPIRPCVKFHSKASASSHLFSYLNAVTQMKEAGVILASALVPTVHAAGRTAGDSLPHVHEGGVGEGESRGLLQDLGETAEAALQAVAHQRHAGSNTQPAGVSCAACLPPRPWRPGAPRGGLGGSACCLPCTLDKVTCLSRLHLLAACCFSG